jgi:hypothetical protein
LIFNIFFFTKRFLTFHYWVDFLAITNIYEKLPNLLGLRQIALDEVYKLIQYEDENTDYLDIAPVCN